MATDVAEVFRKAGAYFMGESPVHRAAQRISQALNELEVPHVIVGGFALGVHGYVRVTEDIGVLVTKEGHAKFKARFLGLGWVERFPGSKGVWDAVENVKVDFLIAGDFPGDGKPGPLPFPLPESVIDRGVSDELPFIALERLIELKLATYITAPGRPRDLDDVIRLIQLNKLEAGFRERLHPYVQAKYHEAFQLAKSDEEMERKRW
jgi:hypothetical protein